MDDEGPSNEDISLDGVSDSQLLTPIESSSLDGAGEIQRQIPSRIFRWQGGNSINVHGRAVTYHDKHILTNIHNQLVGCEMLDRFERTPFGQFLRFDRDVVFPGKLFLYVMSREVIVAGDDSSPNSYFLFGNHLARFGHQE